MYVSVLTEHTWMLQESPRLMHLQDLTTPFAWSREASSKLCCLEEAQATAPRTDSSTHRWCRFTEYSLYLLHPYFTTQVT